MLYTIICSTLILEASATTRGQDRRRERRVDTCCLIIGDG